MDRESTLSRFCLRAQYRVQVSKAGFKTLIKPGIILNVSERGGSEFTLASGSNV